MNHLKKRGFSIVEVLVVVVIIGILASVVTVAYNGVTARARDTDRLSDMHAIAEAIQLYRQKCGNDVTEASTTPDCGDDGSGHSGCGSNGEGRGWLNFSSPTASYPKSIVACLQAAGYLTDGGDNGYADPFGCSTTGGSASGLISGTKCGKKGYAYMKYPSPSGTTCVYARMETTDKSGELKNTSGNPCGSSAKYVADHYGMNYMLLVK